MRILIDECLPRRLIRELTGHEAQTVPQAGWAGKSNGELLRLAVTQFDAFVTIDQNLVYQQQVTGLDMAVVVLGAESNRFEDIRSLIPELLAALSSVTAGDLIRIG